MKEIWTTMASMTGFGHSARASSTPSSHWSSVSPPSNSSTASLTGSPPTATTTSTSIDGARLTLTRGLNSATITFSLSKNDRSLDTYNGATIKWEHVVTQRKFETFSWRPLPEVKPGFTLRMKKNREVVLGSYQQLVVENHKIWWFSTTKSSFGVAGVHRSWRRWCRAGGGGDGGDAW